MSRIEAFPRPGPLFPIKGWSDVPPDVEAAEIHGLAVNDFAPLLDLHRLRALRAACDTPKQHEIVGRLDGLRWLALDHCSKGLKPFAGLAGLQALELFAFKAASLDGIEGLGNLEYLRIEHAPKLASLKPLAACRKLRWLSLSTPAGWDASRKTIKVDSLAPLAELNSLEFVNLMGIEPRADGLRPLGRLKKLKELSVSHVFSFALEDYAALAAALPRTEGSCLQATYPPGIAEACPKCRTARLCLTGPAPRVKARLCPRCDAAKLTAHEAEFARLKTLHA